MLYKDTSTEKKILTLRRVRVAIAVSSQINEVDKTGTSVLLLQLKQ